MADVEVVIKIPEEQYDLILKSDIGATSVFVSKECMMYSIKNGTPLPEHHSDLIDRNELLKKEVWGSFGEIGDDAPCVFKADIEEAPTIIPATDRTATWKRVASDVHGLIDMYECSNCGAQPPKKQIGVTWGWDFVDCCPNCKAKMLPVTKEEKQTLFDKMEEEFGKDWDVPKQTATKEKKSCLDCLYYPNTSACESCEGYSSYINIHRKKVSEWTDR